MRPACADCGTPHGLDSYVTPTGVIDLCWYCWAGMRRRPPRKNGEVSE